MKRVESEKQSEKKFNPNFTDKKVIYLRDAFKIYFLNYTRQFPQCYCLLGLT